MNFSDIGHSHEKMHLKDAKNTPSAGGGQVIISAREHSLFCFLWDDLDRMACLL
jgi:hypothetical protein